MNKVQKININLRTIVLWSETTDLWFEAALFETNYLISNLDLKYTTKHHNRTGLGHKFIGETDESD